MQMLIWVICGFILLHLFKMIRFYLVLMEHGIGFYDFVLLYFRTTLINLAIPFKLGELYRIEEVWRMTGIWQVGVLSVVVDRYFDIVSLILWLLLISLISKSPLSVAFFIFLIVIAAGVIFYKALPGSFGYLNGFLLKRRASKRSMAALKGLNVVKDWYDYTVKLIAGRSALMVLTGALGWGVEILTLKCLARFLGGNFYLSDFSDYIDSIFLAGGAMQIQKSYTFISVIAFAVLTVLGYVIWFATKKVRDEERGKR